MYEVKIPRSFDSVETAAAFPYSGRVVSEMNNEMLKEKVLFYRINNNLIEVVRIIHNARNFKDINNKHHGLGEIKAVMLFFL
ncbi:type II toxin-antitoxin system RelE/ParE family toxin [Metabacillus litoralis]|uniref:type II toxin-antitoxin system RelE/ParE family toxin n=1 Tax=Metabacillus litoralis TaxID=152268 RepID=UPI001CFF4F17|nr:hypothetical protein [Metabacillus litoralis]